MPLPSLPLALLAAVGSTFAGAAAGWWAAARRGPGREPARCARAIEESEREHPLLFTGNPTPMFIFDEETLGFLAVNDAAVAVYGWSRDEFLTMSVLDIRPLEDRALARETIRRSQGALDVAVGEFRHLRKSGDIVQVDVTVSSIHLHGRPARLCAMRDVTDRKRAEEAARRYELVVQHSRDVLLFLDLSEGRILEANPAATLAYGYTRDELLALRVADLRASQTCDRTDEQMSLANGGGILFETLHRRKDGSVFPVEVSSRGVSVGARRMLVSVVRDITERKNARAREDEERQRAERRAAELDAIFDSLAQPLVVSDARGRVARVNPAFRSLFGIVADWAGLDIAERIRRVGLETAEGKPVDPAETPGARALAGETVRGVLLRWPLEDGSVLHLLTSSAPIRTAVGIVGAVVVFTDITERVRAEEALRDADRRKSEFLAVLSHELRNPLAPLKNSVYLLERAPAESEAAQRALAVLRRQVDQLARLVDDLLDVTRISRNKIQLQRERVDLSELVRATVEDQRSLFEEAQVRLELTRPSRPILVFADRTRLAQVIGNLLQNAVKFTPAGGVATVTLGVSGSEAELRVTDTGVGIPAAVLDRLFEPFVQADATLAHSQGGLGLGLALVRGLVSLHGGRVRAESRGPGVGSEFVVVLPLEPSGEAPALSDPKPSDRPSRRVLLIEDNRDAAETLRDALELCGHQVSVAYDGREGLAQARRDHPDVIFCDIGLPGLDGYDVARGIRAAPELAGTAVYALSGYARPEDLERASRAGFHGHIAKPPNLDTLEQVLAREPGKAKGLERL